MRSFIYAGILILLNIFKSDCLLCYEGSSNDLELRTISCGSSYCVSAVMFDETRTHTCTSNAYCSQGEGCFRTRDAGEVYACCCVTDLCNSGNKKYFNVAIFIAFFYYFL
uniref:Activin_recp domain-containing protein n=1 Tax=Rhabditophanes sp. KR3021 TaxID=114890 RepID=A0AC35TLW2_9BILA